MNIAMVYYSYSGNTHKAAEIIEEILKSQNHTVKRLRIEAPNESKSFLIQALRGLTRRKAEIAPIETDLSGYELIIFGTPVWAREMAPAMRSYLAEATGLSGKKAIIFVTYGSGFGKRHCLDSLECVLQEKGIKQAGRFSLSQFRVDSRVVIETLLNKRLSCFALDSVNQEEALWEEEEQLE